MRRSLAAALLSISAFLAGCGLQNTRPAAPHANGGMQGQVMGGQQPVAGALIQLYAVGQGGDGSTATPLLVKPVLTNVSGGFNITGNYSCGNATLVYLTATGGDPGQGSVNADLALMTALGPCSSLTASTMIQVNELSTVAATSALYPYMSRYNAIGSGSNDAAALANAFTLSAEFVDPTSGSTPGVGVPPGMVVPSAELNSLADILASCINSRGGVAGDGSLCGQLFSLTTPPGKQAPADSPTDTIAALLNVALNPTQNTTALFNLSPAASVFQPQLASAPASFTVNLMPASLYFGVNSLSFPSAPVGGPTASQPVTLTNVSSTSITLTGLGFAGDGAADYSQTNNCPATLARGVTCTIQVTFAPSSVYGQRNAVLSVSYANTSGTVALSGTALQPSTGPVSISTGNLLFYDRTIAQTVTLSNLSADPLVISGINLSAANWTDTTTCGNVLSANSTCTVTITPVNTPGQFSGSLSFVTGDTTDSQTVSLTTDALYTQLISFDYQNETYGYPTRVGAGTTTNPVTLTGGVYAGMSSGYTFYNYTATLGGPSAKDFQLFASNCPTRSGTTCTLQYSFFPTAAGTRYATVVTNANEHFLFEGKAIAGPLSYSVSPAALTFASTALGTSSSVQYLTVTNTSGTVISYARAASSSSEFVLSDDCSGGSETPGQTCNISVTFKPTAIGTRTGVLTLKDTTGVTQTLNLTGQGAGGPTAPYTLAFGNVALNTSSSKAVTVVIPGQHAAVASIAGTNSPFSLPGSTFCPAAAPCSYTVAFTPTAVSNSTDMLVVTDLLTGYTSSTLLSGAGGIPVVTPSPASLDFGLRNVGQTSVAQTVTLTNRGNAPLQVNSVSITGANATDFSQSNTCTTSLAAGASCTVSVTDMPVASGARTASLVIASNGATVFVALTATGN